MPAVKIIPLSRSLLNFKIHIGIFDPISNLTFAPIWQPFLIHKMENIQPSVFSILSGGYANQQAFNPSNYLGHKRAREYSNKGLIIRQMPRVAVRGKTQTKRKRSSKHRYSEPRKVPRLIPNHKYGLLKWVSADLSYAPASTTGGVILNLNAANDPGKGVDAQQPQWWTELSAIYKYYKVLSTRWHMHISNTTADQLQGAYCVTIDAESPPTTAAGLTECIQKGQPFWVGATDENLTNHVDLVGTWSLKKQISINNEKGVNDSSYAAEVASTPVKEYVLNFVFGSAGNISIKYRVVMEMFVELYDLQQNAPD